MTNWESATWAALIGAAGSLAYFTALYFGFIINQEIFDRLWPTRRGVRLGTRIFRIFWFTLLGAAVAFIFQLPERYLAPIQAFIVGTTWPTIVSQVLTARQADSPEAIKNQISQLLGPS
jgi:hypothetical protein